MSGDQERPQSRYQIMVMMLCGLFFVGHYSLGGLPK